MSTTSVLRKGTSRGRSAATTSVSSRSARRDGGGSETRAFGFSDHLSETVGRASVRIISRTAPTVDFPRARCALAATRAEARNPCASGVPPPQGKAASRRAAASVDLVGGNTTTAASADISTRATVSRFVYERCRIFNAAAFATVMRLIAMEPEASTRKIVSDAARRESFFKRTSSFVMNTRRAVPSECRRRRNNWCGAAARSVASTAILPLMCPPLGKIALTYRPRARSNTLCRFVRPVIVPRVDFSAKLLRVASSNAARSASTSSRLSSASFTVGSISNPVCDVSCSSSCSSVSSSSSVSRGARSERLFDGCGCGGGGETSSSLVALVARGSTTNATATATSVSFTSTACLSAHDARATLAAYTSPLCPNTPYSTQLCTNRRAISSDTRTFGKKTSRAVATRFLNADSASSLAAVTARQSSCHAIAASTASIRV